MRGQITILLLLAVLAAARVGKFRPQKPVLQASGLHLPDHYSFTSKSTSDKGDKIDSHISFDGELFYTITNQTESIFFVSNNTMYLHQDKRCDSVTLTKNQTELFFFTKYANEHSTPLNKPCKQGDTDGQKYKLEQPGSGSATSIVLCASMDGKKLLYVETKVPQANITSKSEIVDFRDHPDESLNNYHLPPSCTKHNRPDGVSLNLPKEYSYRYDSKSVTGKNTYATSGTVNQKEDEAVVVEKGQFSDHLTFFFRDNRTQYSSYSSFCSAYKMSSNYNYEDEVSQFEANQNDTTSIQFGGDECQHEGQSGYIWERFGSSKLCVNKAGDTPLYFEVAYSADNRVRKNFYDFKNKPAADAPWQMPKLCLDAKVGGK